METIENDPDYYEGGTLEGVVIVAAVRTHDHTFAHVSSPDGMRYWQILGLLEAGKDAVKEGDE